MPDIIYLFAGCLGLTLSEEKVSQILGMVQDPNAIHIVQSEGRPGPAAMTSTFKTLKQTDGEPPNEADGKTHQ